jgi:peptidoglycan/xylan/chitin deacetylase (PgdA/CDA1 family)
MFVRDQEARREYPRPRGNGVDQDHWPPLRRAAISRRVLFAVGGLMLLGEVVATEAAGAPSRAAPRALAGPAGTARPEPSVGSPASSAAAPPGARPAAAPSHPAQRHLASVRGAGDRPLYHIDDGRKAIALTIDDGPSPVYTPQLLRLLNKYRVTATFSMIGANVAAHPGLAREVADAGHMIVNHTWTHANLTALAPAAVRDQMSRASDAIHHATGTAPAMFRAPYGAWSPAVLKRCEQMRLAPLDWSVDPRDWARPGVSAIVRNIMRNTRTGSIILEHDGGGNRSQTVAALGIVLPRLLASGYRFRTP